MNYAKIKYCDIANGPGVRTSLFVSGCTRHCEDCFNPEAWSFDYGNEFTDETALLVMESIRSDHIAGLTILGGEPFEPENRKEIYKFLLLIRNIYIDTKSIWMYTGYTWEELIKQPLSYEILKLVNVIVDGPFDKNKKDLLLRFRGSSNQRIIDVRKSITEKRTILWKDDSIFEKHEW